MSRIACIASVACIANALREIFGFFSLDCFDHLYLETDLFQMFAILCWYIVGCAVTNLVAYFSIN